MFHPWLFIQPPRPQSPHFVASSRLGVFALIGSSASGRKLQQSSRHAPSCRPPRCAQPQSRRVVCPQKGKSPLSVPAIASCRWTELQHKAANTPVRASPISQLRSAISDSLCPHARNRNRLCISLCSLCFLLFIRIFVFVLASIVTQFRRRTGACEAHRARTPAPACPCFIRGYDLNGPTRLRFELVRAGASPLQFHPTPRPQSPVFFASSRLGAFALSVPAAAVQVETISTQSCRGARTQRGSHIPNGTHSHTLRKVAASFPISED